MNYEFLGSVRPASYARREKARFHTKRNVDLACWSSYSFGLVGSGWTALVDLGDGRFWRPSPILIYFIFLFLCYYISMTWAFKRQISYLVILLVVFSFFGFLIISPRLNKAPTCTDGKQNGDEAGVDCGGSCAVACVYQEDKVAVLWARSFLVVPGRYNAVAYLENHNKNTAVSKVSYKFRFADKNNVYIGKREGTTFVPPAGKFAVFEPAINLGNSLPVYTTFEFTGVPLWVKVSEEKINQLKILVSDIKLQNEDTSPVLSATIKNGSLFTIPELSVVAILYDADRNALSASRTYFNELDGEESKEINFTWPLPIIGKVVAKEIIPLYNIFSVKLK